MSDDVEALAKKWHQAKATVKAFDEATKKALQDDPDYQQAKFDMAETEGKLLKLLDDMNVNNFNTDYGTVHTVVRQSASIQDVEAFQNFVIECRTWGALDWKANASFVKSFLQEHKELPPGVQLNATRTLSITAPKAPL